MIFSTLLLSIAISSNSIAQFTILYNLFRRPQPTIFSTIASVSPTTKGPDFIFFFLYCLSTRFLHRIYAYLLLGGYKFQSDHVFGVFALIYTFYTFTRNFQVLFDCSDIQKIHKSIQQPLRTCFVSNFLHNITKFYDQSNDRTQPSARAEARAPTSTREDNRASECHHQCH